MKIILSFVCFIFIVQMASAQISGQLELRAGVVAFDLITEPGDFFKDRQGWGSQVDLNYLITRSISERFNIIGGIGYTNFYYWDADLFDLRPRTINIVNPEPIRINNNISNSNYLNLKYGLQFLIPKYNISAKALFAHYLLVQPLQGYNQRRMFLNLDLGLEFRTGKRTVFKIYSPITIHPIIEDGVFTIILPSGNPPVNRFVEMNGLLLGLGYNLN